MTTYDSIAGTSETMDYVAGATNTNLYPDSNNISIFGPLWLPRIYGKDLTAFEIASSGKIAITVNDVHALDISRLSENSNFSTVLSTKQDDSLEIVVNSNNMSIIMDASSNNINITTSNDFTVLAEYGSAIVSASNEIQIKALSNLELVSTMESILLSAADSNVSISLDASTYNTNFFSSNDIIFTASNDFSLTAHSNVNVYAANGALNLVGQGSNTSITLDDATDNVNVYALKDVVVSASNDFSLTAHSNVEVFATNGAVKLFGQGSNTFVTLDDTTDNVNVYALKDVVVSASNDFSLTAQSNVEVFATGGAVKLFGQGSNTSITLDDATDNVNVYALKDVVVSASNDFSLTAQSNVEVFATGGAVKLFGQGSNTSITLDDATDNVNVYALKDVVVSASNDFSLTAQSNVEVFATGGAVKLFGQGSNTSITLDDATDNVNVYALNDVVVSASNDFSLTAHSNVEVFATNGAVKLFGQGSNTSITLDDVTDTVSVSALSNVVVSASNNFSLTAKSNVEVFATNGAVKLFGQGSNTSITLDDVTDTVSVSALSNVVVSASNNFSLTAKSNVEVFATNGAVKLFGQGSNTFVTLDDVTDTVSVYALSNVVVSASNNFSLTAKSNVDVYAANGAVKLFGQGSNTFVTLDDVTDTVSVYALSNVVVSASNNFSLSAKSNVDVYAANGAVKLFGQGSNTSITLDDVTDNLSVYALKDVVVSASNNFSLNASSNITLTGSDETLVTIAPGSNITLQMNGANGTTTWNNSELFELYTSNAIYFTAVNTVGQEVIDIDGNNLSSFTLDGADAILYTVSNAIVNSSSFLATSQSNIALSATDGNMTINAHNSNMFVELDAATDVLTVYGSNGVVINSSNDVNVTGRDNVLLTAITGEIGLYANSNIELTADSSNMYITMEKTGDVVSIYSLSNIDLASGKVIGVNATSNINIQSSNVNVLAQSNIIATASNNVLISACNDVIIEGANKVNLSARSFEWAADSNINFYISGAPVNPQDPIFSIGGTSVSVRGDLFITGSINTSNIINTTVTQETLKVSDKTIKLANVGDGLAGDSNPLDGAATNDGAGIEVDGFPNPTVVTNSNYWPAHEKSILWRYGVNGTLDLGTSNADTESYWEVLGGGMRVTHRKDIAGTLRDVSFTFRVNQLDELELVKKFWNTNTNAYVYKRIAKFGRLLA